MRKYITEASLLADKIDEKILIKLEYFFCNTNLTKDQRAELITIFLKIVENGK
jgi:hypothetical protein